MVFKLGVTKSYWTHIYCTDPFVISHSRTPLYLLSLIRIACSIFYFDIVPWDIHPVAVVFEFEFIFVGALRCKPDMIELTPLLVECMYVRFTIRHKRGRSHSIQSIHFISL